MRHIKYKEDNNLENQNPINMKDLDKVMNELNLCEITSEDLGLIRRYLERLILIIERSRIREYMMLTDSKRRLFLINFVAGLGKGFGQAIGFTVLAALVLYLLSTWVDLPVIGATNLKVLTSSLTSALGASATVVFTSSLVSFLNRFFKNPNIMYILIIQDNSHPFLYNIYIFS